MIFFIDTEFSDFKSPLLLSVGITGKDGKDFYFEREDFPIGACSDFVVENVLPHFENNPENRGNLEVLSKKLNQYFQPYQEIVWAIDFQYDWILIIALLNKTNFEKLKIFNIAKFSSMYQDNLDEYFSSLNLIRHHALNDAIALKKCFFGIHQDYRLVEDYTQVMFKHLFKPQ